MQVLILGLLLGSCKDIGPEAPAAGGLRITAQRIGIDFPASFVLTLDGEHISALAPGDSAMITRPAGVYSLAVQGLPANCSVQEPHPRKVTVIGDAVTPVSLAITCAAVLGAMEVQIATEGLDTPSAYELVIGNRSPQPIRSSVVVPGLTGGAHVVALTVPSNCTVSGENPRVVAVATGGMTRDTARTSFAVSCRISTGVLEVTIAATGEDLDPTGITVRAGLKLMDVETIPGSVRSLVPIGQQQVALENVASNCAVQGQHPRMIDVTAGTQTRDTVRTTFQVTCTATEKIAFVRQGNDGSQSLMVAYADGSNVVRITQGINPSWSPQRDRILYTAVDCSEDWYYYGCATLGLSSVIVEGPQRGKTTWITNDARHQSGAWSPDGSRIAIVESATLMLTNANGTSPVYVATTNTLPGLTWVHSPSWSPDGLRLAFACVFVADGNNYWPDICVVNADGTNATRLTTDSWYDSDPAWSPDGTTIAFASSRPGAAASVFLMKPDGADVIPIVQGYSPSWSRDGTRILFARDGLFIAKRDGTGITRLTTGNDDTPVWRR